MLLVAWHWESRWRERVDESVKARPATEVTSYPTAMTYDIGGPPPKSFTSLEMVVGLSLEYHLWNNDIALAYTIEL